MVYSDDMIRRKAAPGISLILIIFSFSFGITSCGIIPGTSPADIVDEFYDRQSDFSGDLPTEMFAEESTELAVEKLLVQRENTYGRYRSHKKIGSNRWISMEADGREESVIFMFEVTCENGRTMESLMIRRGKATEAFRIASYEIKEVPVIRDPSPMGTSST